MALFHTRHKVLSRSKYNTVDACAYRTGTKLVCCRTGEMFDYRQKKVQKVDLLLPEDAPEWAQQLQKCVQENREGGIQHLSDLAEAAEKRKDARVYREFEFALPADLTPEQNYELANELIQDLACSEGMLAIQCFHMDVDPETGQDKPHCHTLLLTRRLTPEGLAPKKETAWNKKAFHEKLFEGVASYTNFHLKKHGISKTIDHRSYKERGIDLEPQPKRSRAVREKEARGEEPAKGHAFNVVKWRNMHRIMRNPEIVFEIVTQSQSTFVWEDVQKILCRYFDDLEAFTQIDLRLRTSKALICLQEGGKTQKAVYTSEAMVRQERELVQLARDLSAKKSHGMDLLRRDKTLAHCQAQSPQRLSEDQLRALHHMTGPESLSCIVGYAGAGKTTTLRAVKEIYEAQGYKVRGLAPTGRAARNLEEAGFKSHVLDKFLWSFDQGREQLHSKTLVVLDEAGMVDTRRFARFLRAMERLGCKVITVGDGAQLQAVQAGPAFRLVTGRLQAVRLDSILRQKKAWQREATRLFGEYRPREALEIYQKQGAFRFVEEHLPDARCPDRRVQTFLISRRMAGNIWFEMLQERGVRSDRPLRKEDWERLTPHLDRVCHQMWRATREEALGEIQEDLKAHLPFLEKYNVDPKILKVDSPPPYLFDETKPQNLCDLRRHTKEVLTRAWVAYHLAHPDKTSLVLTYSQRDGEDLNAEIRHTLKEKGILAKQEKLYRVISEERNDFNDLIEHKRDRSFAVGDRLLFTKNNQGLGVSNGTLGTVIELTKQTIRVVLDGKDGEGKPREVSFAPKLYPTFDHGWATTIHKAQGVTVDRTFKLASFEENRNLAYVGMTRHRENVRVFCSRFDFWREEKVIDRLSASAEKLASLDYKNAPQRRWQMKQDAWITKASPKVHDFAKATHYVGGRVWKDLQSAFFQKAPPSFIAPEKPTLYRAWSEPERAKALLFGEERVLFSLTPHHPLI